METKKGKWKTYECKWCGEIFSRFVYYKGIHSLGELGRIGKKSAYSSVVRCPHCQQNLPTWEKEEREGTHGVGQLHVHGDRW